MSMPSPARLASDHDPFAERGADFRTRALALGDLSASAPRVVLALSLVLLVGACDGARRVSGGGNTPNTVRRDASTTDSGNTAGVDDAGRLLDDAGRPIDGGFDDAGRPIDVRPDAGPSAPDGGSGGGLTPEAYCAALVQLDCEANQRCCTDPTRRARDLSACIAKYTMPDCLGGAAFRDGRARFDASLARVLLEKLTAQALACQSMSKERYIAPVVGAVPAGGDCTAIDNDLSPLFSCAPGTYCRGLEEGSLTCVAFVPTGAPCQDGRCIAGDTCDLELSICRRGGALGGPCGELAGECADSYCNNGTCSATPPAYDYCFGE
jgi:hypothetical protein